MRNSAKKVVSVGVGLLAAFVLWTVLILFIDVQAIGPRASSVGLATVNGAFHRLTGVHWLTDIVGGALFSAGAVTIYYGLERYQKGVSGNEI